MYGYIYLTTNLINNKKYIGQHKHENYDVYYYGSGIKLTRAIKKYGKDNFKVEVLEECLSRDALNDAEKYWISYYNAVDDDNFYNIEAGGNDQGKITDEIREKMSKAKLGKPAHNKGIPMSDEQKVKISATKRINKRKGWNKGLTKYTDERIAASCKPCSLETREKISKAKKGQPSRLKGRKLTEEQKAARKSSYKKRPKPSEETKLKQSLAKSQKVLCIETGVIYKSIWEAAQAMGYKSYNPISYCIHGKQETAKGYHWKLIEE